MITTRRSSSLLRLDVSILSTGATTTTTSSEDSNDNFNAARSPLSTAALASWNLATTVTTATTTPSPGAVIEDIDDDDCNMSIAGVSEIADEEDVDVDRDDEALSSPCSGATGQVLPFVKDRDEEDDDEDKHSRDTKDRLVSAQAAIGSLPQEPPSTKMEEEEEEQADEEGDVVIENDKKTECLPQDDEKETKDTCSAVTKAEEETDVVVENNKETESLPEDEEVPSSPSPSPQLPVVITDSCTGVLLPLNGQIHSLQNEWMKGTVQVRLQNEAELVVQWQVSFPNIPPSSDLFAGYEVQLVGTGKKAFPPKEMIRQDPTCHVTSHKGSKKSLLRKRRSSRNEAGVESAPKESDATTYCLGWKATNFMKTIASQDENDKTGQSPDEVEFNMTEVFKMSCDLCQRKKKEWHFLKLQGADSKNISQEKEVHFVMYWVPTTTQMEGSRKKSNGKAWKSLRLPKKSSSSSLVSSPKALQDKIKILDWKLKLE